MPEDDLQKLVEDAAHEVLGNGKRMRVLGLTETAGRFLDAFLRIGLLPTVIAVHSTRELPAFLHGVQVRDLEALSEMITDEVLVVATDSNKESLIRAAIPFIERSQNPTPKVIVAGYGHYKYRDSNFYELQLDLLVESLANGHPNNLIHIYQCLENASRQGLVGDVVEFGMYQGGTTMFISQAMERLGMAGALFGFDNFAGFPPKKSLLDMYDDPGCAFASFEDVSAYLSRRSNVHIIAGDICETAKATLSGRRQDRHGEHSRRRRRGLRPRGRDEPVQVHPRRVDGGA